MTDEPAEAATPSQSWWKRYVKSRPNVERFPGSYIRPVIDAAERGEADAVETLKRLGIYDTVVPLA